MHPQILERIANNDTAYRIYDPEEVEERFYQWLVDNGCRSKNQSAHIIPAGKNFGSFDRQFLEKDLSFGKKVRMAHRIMDPAILFFDPEVDDRLPSLEVCLERAGMESMVAHTAVEDALQVVKLLRWYYKIG